MAESKKRKSLKVNIIQFIIGVILLFIGFMYISKNDAERVSFVSGFNIIFQKAYIWYRNMTVGDGKDYESQLNTIRNFSEIIKTIEGGSCSKDINAKLLDETYKQLKKDSIEEYKNNVFVYNKVLGEYYSQINKYCK